jgi:primary-amine oxidase
LLNRRWIEIDDDGNMTFNAYGVGLDVCPIVLEEPTALLGGVGDM